MARLVVVISTVGLVLSLAFVTWGASLGAAQEGAGSADALEPRALGVSAIDFGDQPVNTASEKTITLTDQDGQKLPALAIKVTPDHGFVAANPSCAWPDQSTTCEIAVTFSPTDEGRHNAELTVDDDLMRIRLSGNGVAARPSDQQTEFVSVLLLVLGALGSVGILALIVISFKQQSKLANLGGKLANLGVTISYLDKHVARSQATDDILRALKSLDDRIEPKAGTRTPKEIESESFGDGEIPKSWQTPAIATSADSPRGSSRQTELPLDAYCQGSMTLESLTEQATRQGVRWGSFVTRGGQFEFNEGTSANKLIGFRRTKASEFWLVLGEGTIWNPDFTLFFELKDEREPLVGERILTTKPAIARFDHGTPLDVIKGVMRTP